MVETLIVHPAFEYHGRRSPLLGYKDLIEASVVNVAPERGAELTALTHSRRIQLEFDHEPGFALRVFTDLPCVFLSIRGLEYLWAAAYCYVTWHDAYINEQMLIPAGSVGELELSGDPLCAEAIIVLRATINNLFAEHLSPWPNAFVAPDRNRVDGSLQHQADELFLCAIGWILHHEIGHVVRGHGPASVEAHAEEFDADEEAIQWVLRDAPQNTVIKRGLGIVSAIVAIRGVSRGASTHPDPEYRLDRVLNTPRIQGDEMVGMFAVVALQCQCAVQGNRIKIESETLDDIIADLLIASSRIPK